MRGNKSQGKQGLQSNADRFSHYWTSTDRHGILLEFKTTQKRATVQKSSRSRADSAKQQINAQQFEKPGCAERT
jgi:hypothetical protein